MKKKILIGFIIFSFLCAIIVFLIIPPIMMNKDKIDYKIFSDFSELNCLNVYKINSLDISNDKSLNLLEYDENMGLTLNFNGAQFQFFAYTFINDESAQKYFENTSGQKSSKSWSYFTSGNYYSNIKIVVFKNNKSYRFEGANYSKSQEFMKFLSLNFKMNLVS